jgi:hypothetical protein
VALAGGGGCFRISLRRAQQSDANLDPLRAGGELA